MFAQYRSHLPGPTIVDNTENQEKGTPAVKGKAAGARMVSLLKLTRPEIVTKT